MIVKMLTPDLSVMPQIREADIAELARRGFKSIIGNRPEGEAFDQPRWSDLKAAALAHGLETVHIPVVASDIDDADIRAFGDALDRLPKPIAAFCRTGTRSALLWVLASNDAQTKNDYIQIAADQGYDLTPFRARIGTSIAKAI